MKIRTGFISNSSSSCFICGVYGENEYNIEEMIPILQEMLDFYNKMEETQYHFDDVFEVPRVATEEDIDHVSDFMNVPSMHGKIIIMSTGDNSIPYELFEFIETKFNAKRIHLG